MKRLFLYLLLPGTLLLTSCRDDVVTRDVAQLPEPARQFVQSNFSQHHISYIKIDRELFSTEYKVVLTNGDELEFDSDGEWKEVECKRTAVPVRFLPDAVKLYLNQNFATDSVEKVKRTSRNIEVELGNGLEVIFDTEGNFKRMDD
jgi:hypothetical protein